MKKSISLMVITALICALLTSCTTAQKPQNDAETLTDSTGVEITLPDSCERIISLAPANTEIIVSLGLGDKLVAVDSYSTGIEGIPADISVFDMMAPDTELLVALEPDVIFTTGMSSVEGDDVFKPVKDAGECVVTMATPTSIDGIREGIALMGQVLGKSDEAAAIVKDMDDRIAAVKEIGDTISEKKSVYFEISAAPYLYSFGTDVFLNEMLTVIGAENILADQSSWLSVSEETVLEKNPDVILTNVNYIDAPVDEIRAREGWDSVNAVKNGSVYYIDTDSSTLPNQNIAEALEQMARAVYPEYYN